MTPWEELIQATRDEAEAARLVRGLVRLLAELRQPSSVEGSLKVRLRHRPGREPSLGDVQREVTSRHLTE